MYSFNKSPARKVVKKHISKSTGLPTFGYCPWCGAAMSYRNKHTTECLCCKGPVIWSDDSSET